MDPNYAMAKFGLESKNMLKSKHRGCWYYTKYFFFFLSIIQFLIILGLVLFMLYGNAHFGTEQRLLSVENRLKNQSIDYLTLTANYSNLRSKCTITEKQTTNCTAMLATAKRQLQIMPNRTLPGRQVMPLPPSQEVCRNYQVALDKLNTTYIIETLQLRYEISMLQRNYERLKENCDQANNSIAKRVNELASKKEMYQNTKEDLEKQVGELKTLCTSINNKFAQELENMRIRFEGIINKNEPFYHSKCWTISGDIKTNIDQTINRMKLDVNMVSYENTQLKTENAQVSENFHKCTKEKTTIASEKNNLSKEKAVLEKELSEKKEELNKSYSKYMKKEQDLENCRKIQNLGRMPVGPFSRN
ncbi:uncharacterized protein RB166_020574 [Leptodactylus fuscus]|uniref:uncharacterized protein LOC142212506 n=1 Tax=Leptodactylus fuscus TaxID=238119 RepID=UPI003F4F29C7